MSQFQKHIYATAQLLFRSQEVEMWQERGYLEMSQAAQPLRQRVDGVASRLS